jgi:hypothetical protein
MLPVYFASVLAVVTVSPSPSPQPTTLKTIEYEHSVPFCTALRATVRPALAALLQNDRLIERGHAAFVTAGYNVTHGGIPDGGGFNGVVGPPQWEQSQPDTIIVQMQQRALAKSLEDNVDTVDTMLAGKKGFATVTAAVDKAKLLTITSQLDSVVAQQRTAVNIISGEVENSEMEALFNHAPSWGGADSVHGASVLEAMEAGHGRDQQFILNVWQADKETKVPFNDPYKLFAQGLAEDQSLIAESENVASKSIMDAAAECN